jgi:hypothetical protein
MAIRGRTTDSLAASMFDPTTHIFLREYAPEFCKVLDSRDIKKVVRWLERKYRDVIVPIAKEHPIVAALFEETAGRKTGELLGKYIVDKYEILSPEKKEAWDRRRWLHHGVVGELVVIRATKKGKAFLIGLGKGLMQSDLQDADEWRSPEYWEARRIMEGMR